MFVLKPLRTKKVFCMSSSSSILLCFRADIVIFFLLLDVLQGTISQFIIKGFLFHLGKLSSPACTEPRASLVPPKSIKVPCQIRS